MNTTHEFAIGAAVAIYILKTVFEFLTPLLKKKQSEDTTSAGLPAVSEPCSFASENSGELAAKIIATHKVVTAEDEDGAKRVYVPRSINRNLDKLVEIQAAQQRLLERMDANIERQV